jgi:hypothetical protein
LELELYFVSVFAAVNRSPVNFQSEVDLKNRSAPELTRQFGYATSDHRDDAGDRFFSAVILKT